MLRRSMMVFALAAALLFMATPARAGGWAVVTLDDLPAQVRAGQTLQLGFMVRQHGRTPTNAVEPYLVATKQADGAVSFVNQEVPVSRAKSNDKPTSIRAYAQQQGPEGHFVIEVTFPSAGVWEWEIVPEPFGGTQFEPLTVLAAPADQPSARATEPATLPAAASDTRPAIFNPSALALACRAAADGCGRAGILQQTNIVNRLAA